MTVQAFLSYAPRDQEAVLEFEQRCAPLLKTGRLKLTSYAPDTRGVALSPENKQRIEQSDIFIAFFTQDYVYTGVCRDELYIALQYHLAGKLEILPISWKECHWTSIPGTIQRLVLPKDKRIVTYKEGWKADPEAPWNQIFNRLALYLQKAEALAENPKRAPAPSPIIPTPQEQLHQKPAPLPANEALGAVPLSEEARNDFVRKSLQTISWIFQKRLIQYQEENPFFSEKLEIISEELSIASLHSKDGLTAQASLVIASRSDPLTIKMGNAQPPSLLCYYEGLLKQDGFAVSMGEFLLTDKGRMEISPLPSCILEVTQGPSCLGWTRTKKNRSNLRTKLSIAERPSQNGFSPEEVANIFWEFFIEPLNQKLNG